MSRIPPKVSTIPECKPEQLLVFRAGGQVLWPSWWTCLRSQAKGKCEKIRDETYSRILETTMKLARYSMQPFAGIYSKDRRFARSSWLCLCKESHLLSGQCSVYGDLTHKYIDLTEDKSLVEFSRGPATRPGRAMVLMCVFVCLSVCLSPKKHGPLGTFWIPWTFRYLLDTLEL